jgi:NAD(P)H dehydrogenase (quinone)
VSPKWILGVSGFASQGYDSAISAQLDLGVLEYCGVQERRLELLYGSIEGESHVDRILLDAERLASEY